MGIERTNFDEEKRKRNEKRTKKREIKGEE